MATITKSIGTSSRDYSTITAWEADLDNGAIYASGDVAVGECYNDSTFVEDPTVDGGGTIGLSAVTLRSAAGEGHTGVADGVVINGVVTCDGIAGITFTFEHLRIVGGRWQLRGTYNAVYGNRLIAHSYDTSSSATTTSALYLGNVSGSTSSSIGLRLSNSMGWDLNMVGGGTRSVAMAYIAVGSRYGYAHNCTFFGVTSNATGSVWVLLGGSTTRAFAKNCIAMGATGGGGTVLDFAGVGQQYNMSEDASASGISPLPSMSPTNQFVSTTAGSEDLHLKSGADAIDAGTDLGTSPTGVNIDIDGRDRDAEGDTWDIGAHEYVAVGGDASVSSSDSVTVSVTDTGASTADLASADSTTVATTESASVVQSLDLTSADSVTIATTEFGVPGAAVAASDATAVATTESGSLANALTAADSTTVSTTESGSLGAALAGSESISVGTTESGSVVAFDAKASNDALGLALTDAPVLQAALTANDNAAVATTDSPALTAGLTASDSTVVSVTHASDISAASETIFSNDSLSLATTESPVAGAALAGADQTIIALVDSPAQAFSPATTDTIGLNLAEIPVVFITCSDSLVVSVTHATVTAANLTSLDDLSLVLVDNAAVNAVLTAADSAGLALSESAAPAATPFTTDSISVGVTELAALALSVTTADTLAIVIEDGVSAAAGLASFDSLDLATGEVPDVWQTKAAADEIALAFDESTVASDFVRFPSDVLLASFTFTTHQYTAECAKPTLTVEVDWPTRTVEFSE